MVKTPIIASISLDGGTLCLDFVNTVHNRVDEPLQDYLLNVLDLIAWAKKLELLDAKNERRLEQLAEDNSKKGRQFFADAIFLRELLYRMFFSISANKKVTPTDLELYNAYLKNHFSHLELTVNAGVYKESWNLAPDSFQLITAPVIKDAHALLLSDKLERIKECPNCGWLFLDRTKNGKRRWCSMKNCGSSVKALEWYYRNKEVK
jgi:predicted RNA-binding Zn ribbon-like protein